MVPSGMPAPRAAPTAASLRARPGRRGASGHPLATLSRRALAYGAALALDDVRALADRLYRYNSIPISLSVNAAQATASPGAHHRGPWRVWDARAFPPGAPVHKLYVSVRPAATHAAWALLMPELDRDGGASSLKVAVRPSSLGRPDRLVAYYDSRDACLEAGRRLAPALRHLPAQGVPFTAAVNDGLALSWASDPPPSLQAPAGQGSWRGWVTWRLAESLVGARAVAVAARVRAARRAMALVGVDSECWSPPW